jgi:thiol-disulfide isomerase/thioredoxin
VKRSSAVRWIVQAALLVAVFLGVHAWQTRGLLPAGDRVVAPSVVLHDLDGREWRLPQDLRGRPAVVYFFAPWCAVCAASSPQLRWFRSLRGSEVPVIMVGLDGHDENELHEYRARHGLERVPVLVGDADVGAAYRVFGYPTYYVLDAHGRVARRDFGYTTVVGLWLRSLWLD